jgi:LacI family transcriptional regulator
MRKVRLGDIARKSGFSLSTISLALNNKPGVSSETRERVFAIAEELGYTLRPGMAEEACSPLTTVGMVLKLDSDTSPQANPFYSRVMMGIEDACRRQGIQLLFATMPVDENNQPGELPSLLLNSDLDGLLMVGVCVHGTMFARSAAKDLPVVLVDGYSLDAAYDAVVSDNFRAAYQAVQYLIDRGHRYIGLAGSEEICFPSLKERRNGYFRALKENDISSTYTANFNIIQSKGYQETTRLLQEHPEITALFCVNDDVASYALRAAQGLGRRVPEDLSIIGYDDTVIALHTNPALTTMHVDAVAMGRAAVQLLALRISNPECACMTVTIHPTLVERESVSVPHALPEKLRTV